MFNLPIKILKTIKLETAVASFNVNDITTLVAQWDARQHITSRHLVIMVNAAGPGVAYDWLLVSINGSLGVYNEQTVYGRNAVSSGVRNTDLLQSRGLDIPGQTTYPNSFGGGTIIFPHAFNSSNHKAGLSMSGGVEENFIARAIRWASNDAIANLTFLTSGAFIVANSVFHIGVVDERYLVEEVLLAVDGQPTFDNIPQGEGDLSVVGYCRTDRVATNDIVLHDFNGDTTAGHYYRQWLQGLGAAASAQAGNDNHAGITIGNTGAANAFGAFVINYPQYTNKNQTPFLSISGFHDSAPDGYVWALSGRRNNVEPINKLHYKPNIGTDFKAGSLFSLYRAPKRIIQRVELAADTPLVTFDNIPQNFEALVLHYYARSDVAALTDNIQMLINTDAVGNNYDMEQFYGNGGVVASSRLATGAQVYSGRLIGNTEGEKEFGSGSLILPEYTLTDRHKHYLHFTGRGENIVSIHSHRWEGLAAITRLDLSPATGPNFLAGSVFELEGILRKEGLPPSEGARI